VGIYKEDIVTRIKALGISLKKNISLLVKTVSSINSIVKAII
jgi:hypothetical protein